MNALSKTAGKFHAGRVMSRDRQLGADRARLGQARQGQGSERAAALRQPRAGGADRRAASQIAAEIDLDLAWEFAPEGEFAFAELAQRLLRRIDRHRRSRRRRCSACSRRRTTSAASARAASRRRPRRSSRRRCSASSARQQVAAQVDAWAAELVDGVCPPPVREQLYRILFKPGQERARIQGRRRGRAAHRPAAARTAEGGRRDRLARTSSTGAASCSRSFPQRHRLRAGRRAAGQARSCRWRRPQAFSIDDSATTEIDDALSVQGLGSGRSRFGIHIAAPALAVGAAVGGRRRSRAIACPTVYMPGHKLTMLPDAVVDAFTLAEGPRAAPASQLYVTLDEATLATLASETRLERVRDRRQPAPRQARRA